jgi:cytochrome c556
LSRDFSRQRRSIAVAIVGATMLAGASLVAAAQDQSVATTKDVIFARKAMMSAISDNMDDIEMMIAVNKIDLDDGHEHGDTISIMLLGFPHLFPPASNQWKPNNPDIDPATDTYASPELWSKFSDFYQRAAAASKIAFNISRADKIDDFKAAAAQLRTACDACHAAYLKTQ